MGATIAPQCYVLGYLVRSEQGLLLDVSDEMRVSDFGLMPCDLLYCNRERSWLNLTRPKQCFEFFLGLNQFGTVLLC